MKLKIPVLIISILVLLVVGYFSYNIFIAVPTETVEQKGDVDTIVVVTSKNGAESTPMPSSAILMYSGDFNTIDDNHWANGSAQIYDTEQGPVLNFSNFDSADGPDLFVYLSKESGLTELNSDTGEFVSLGGLKNQKGEQNYNLPEDYQEYKSVLIWCRAFNVLFSAADLEVVSQ